MNSYATAIGKMRTRVAVCFVFLTSWVVFGMFHLSSYAFVQVQLWSGIFLSSAQGWIQGQENEEPWGERSDATKVVWPDVEPRLLSLNQGTLWQLKSITSVFFFFFFSSRGTLVIQAAIQGDRPVLPFELLSGAIQMCLYFRKKIM